MPRMKREPNPKRHAQSAERLSTISFGLLTGYLGYQIRQAQAAVFRDLMASIADLEITPGEFGLLTMLDENPGISQVDLAAVYKLDKSTLSLAVGRLVKRGLVRRLRSRDDERYYALWLQEPGRVLLKRVRARVEAQESAMDAALRRGERKCLLDMLQRVSRALNR
jgi:DNA-binding MarR family transcriptional regulator